MYTALDLVLIPEKRFITSIVNLNKQLPSSLLKLHNTHTLPHLSICMCRVNTNHLHQLILKLTDYLEILDLSELIDFEVSSIYRHNKNTIGWNLEKKEGLLGLHKSICALFKNYHFDQMDENRNDDFCIVQDHMPLSGVQYLNDFFDKNIIENYQPHITLGQGDHQLCEEWISKTIRFESIALFHMGTGCTCEKLLWETKISNNK